MANEYVIIGIHGADVYTVEENVARVRMFVGDRLIDEDFPLPELPFVVQKNQEYEIYDAFIRKDIQARMTALAGGAPVQAARSRVTEQGDTVYEGGCEHPKPEKGRAHTRPDREPVR